MTIEAKLDALTAAVVALTATLAGAKIGTGVSPSIDAAKPEKPMKAPAAEKAAPAAEKAASYDDVKVPFLKLVAKDRDLALATIKPFGLDSLKAAKPTQYGDVLAAVLKALG